MILWIAYIPKKFWDRRFVTNKARLRVPTTNLFGINGATAVCLYGRPLTRLTWWTPSIPTLTVVVQTNAIVFPLNNWTVETSHNEGHVFLGTFRMVERSDIYILFMIHLKNTLLFKQKKKILFQTASIIL